VIKVAVVSTKGGVGKTTMSISVKKYMQNKSE
jgi:MinD superfamily P-loop ATPase